MLKLKPEFWTKNGREKFVVLSMGDFEKIQELIEDAGLSRILREAKDKEADAPTFSAAEVKRKLELARKRPAKSR